MWIKTTMSNTLDGFLFEKTGKTRMQLTKVLPRYEVDGLDNAADMINTAKSRNQKITLVTDYDADGIMSAIIMSWIFMKNGNPFEVITPKRESEGYGLSDKIMNRIDKRNMLVLVDNGITAIDQIRSCGMPVLVMDHHEAGKELPPADVLIDPEVTGYADFTHYCGSGLALKLWEHMFGKNPAITAYAAVAAIADCVELTGDNRRIVRDGLEIMKRGECSSSLRYLWDKCRMGEASTAEDVAFYMAPVLNAAGRLYDDGAKMVVNALYKDGPLSETCIRRIDDLLVINTHRKDMVTKYMADPDIEEACKGNPRGVIYYRPDIPTGLIGIIAGKIAEAENRPAIVFAKAADGMLKGSARNPGDELDIMEIFDQMRDLMVTCGGHKKAAGLSITEDCLAAFTERFNELLPEPRSVEGLEYDLEVSGEDLPALAEDILSLEPCGEGMPAPKVRVRADLMPNRYGESFSLMGADKSHVKFHFDGFDAVAFGQADKLSGNPKTIDMVGKVGENIYNGSHTLQIIVDDFFS